MTIEDKARKIACRHQGWLGCGLDHSKACDTLTAAIAAALREARSEALEEAAAWHDAKAEHWGDKARRQEAEGRTANFSYGRAHGHRYYAAEIRGFKDKPA